MLEKNSQQRILCLWLPNWPIQRLVVAQPELRRQRVVLFRQDSRRGRLVAAASPLARQDGVRLGMPLSEARSLLKRGGKTPDSNATKFHVIAHDPAADLYAIKKLVDGMDQFSPIVGLQQDTQQPDCILLDITGLANLFGGEFGLAKNVFDHFQEQDYLPYIAVADNIAQAQGMAQFYCRCSSRNRQESSSDQNHTFNEIYISTSDAYRSLPIVALRLPNSEIAMLNRLGIELVSQLMALSRKDLLARFGKEMHRRLDQMTGQIAEPIVTQKKPSKFQAQQLLDYPTNHLETIEVVIERLIKNIAWQMSATQQGALAWEINLYCQEHRLPLKLNVGLFQPTTDASHVVQLARMQLEQQINAKAQASSQLSSSAYGRSRVSFQVTEITVSASSCVLVTQRQRNLFDENPRLDKDALVHLINRLSSRLGRENVVYPTLVSGAQPEHAFQMKPLVNPYSRGPRRSGKEKPLASLSHAMARPLKIFQPAIALKSNKAQGQSPSASHPPRVLLFGTGQHHVIRSWGPERIETGWWRGPMVRRDYWRIETETHHQYWIYRDLRRREWFLQGEF